MPVLPLIDLLLMLGWTALFVGFILKAISLLTPYQPVILGLSSIDFFLMAMAALLFSIALAARTWVKSQSPAVIAERRREETLVAWESVSEKAARGNSADSGEAGTSATGTKKKQEPGRGEAPAKPGPESAPAKA